MNELVFHVKGSSSKPYEVVFLKEGDHMTALCDCMAGQNGQHCKHRFRILDGNPEDIVSDNSDELSTLREWLVGSDLEAVLSEIASAKTREDIMAAKKKAARIMRV
jgi:uncharacterized Zn finger protein